MLPSAEMENKIFRIEGERTTANDLGALFKTAVEYVTEIPGEMGEIKTIVATELDSGLGSTGWSDVTKSDGTGDAAASSANKLWPGHHWNTIKEGLMKHGRGDLCAYVLILFDPSDLRLFRYGWISARCRKST
jgi:hypothetical protein